MHPMIGRRTCTELLGDHLARGVVADAGRISPRQAVTQIAGEGAEPPGLVIVVADGVPGKISLAGHLTALVVTGNDGSLENEGVVYECASRRARARTMAV